MKKYFLTTLIILFNLQSPWAQSTILPVEATVTRTSDNERLRSALGLPDYRVGPGDLFELVYQVSQQALRQPIQLDTDLQVNLGLLGTLDARNKTFSQFKTAIESQVKKSYPLASPLLLFKEPGSFNVLLQGKVHSPGPVSTWGGQRLSELVGLHKTADAGLRRVELIRQGKKSDLDLDLGRVRALPDLDPLVQPGDEINIFQTQRLVSITGAVSRPGLYELLESESVGDLLDFWSGGLTPKADPEYARVYRPGSKGKPQTEFWNLRDDRSQTLQDGDILHIPFLTDRLPRVTLEAPFTAPTQTTSPAGEQILIGRGETAASLVRSRLNSLRTETDLARSILLRQGQILKIDLSSLQTLGPMDSKNDIPLQNGDILVIPIKRSTVRVTGAVQSPGEFPYMADRDWSYYISLAGGYDQSLTWGGGVRITDSFGRDKDQKNLIGPDDQIHVPISLMTGVLREATPYLSLLTTAATLVTTGIALYNILR